MNAEEGIVLKAILAELKFPLFVLAVKRAPAEDVGRQ
jgi:hypothetical protein